MGNEKRHGKGYGYQLGDYLRCEGDYLNGKKINEKWSYLSSVFCELKNGNGYYNNNNIAYSLKDGKGLIKEYNDWGKLKFEGEYLNGKRNGKGKEYGEYGKLIFSFKF